MYRIRTVCGLFRPEPPTVFRKTADTEGAIPLYDSANVHDMMNKPITRACIAPGGAR